MRYCLVASRPESEQHGREWSGVCQASTKLTCQIRVLLCSCALQCWRGLPTIFEQNTLTKHLNIVWKKEQATLKGPGPPNHLKRWRNLIFNTYRFGKLISSTVDGRQLCYKQISRFHSSFQGYVTRSMQRLARLLRTHVLDNDTLVRKSACTHAWASVTRQACIQGPGTSPGRQAPGKPHPSSSQSSPWPRLCASYTAR